MNNTAVTYGLMSLDEQIIPLKGTHIAANLQDLLSEVTVTQTYKNEEKQTIEAIYTFPLPLDAVLLDFSVMLGDKALTGIVIERKVAEESYEEAISDGDTAIMLIQLEPGLYSVNVGNLAENETAIIRFQYTQVHRWTQDSLRWHLPTVLAPRYGQPSVAPYQIPAVDITVEHLFTLTVTVHGILSNAVIDSPSHDIRLQHLDQSVKIHLHEGKAFLDRDLIINFRLANDKVSAISDRDVDGYVSMASFCPMLPENVSPTIPAKELVLLVDCSGSMAGESIGQARIALLNILETLSEQDRFFIVRFGSHVVNETPNSLQATTRNIALARNIVAKMNADLGGTEIFSVLEYAIDLISDSERSDMLLISDGEVWDGRDKKSQTRKIIKQAQKVQLRIFTVGVGSAVSERLVRELADATQGACELVNPHENMAEKIERHFKRIYCEPAQSLAVQWPIPTEWQTEPKHFFLGDTVHVFARFKQKPVGSAQFSATFMHSNCTITQQAKIRSIVSTEALSTLARITAYEQLKTLNNKDKVALALQYQLLCEETAYLIVAGESEKTKSDGFPVLRKVPHMLASGWSGVGQLAGSILAAHERVMFSEEMYDLPEIESYEPLFNEPDKSRMLGSFPDHLDSSSTQTDEWIQLPFPEGIEKEQLTLLIDGEKVIAASAMMVKRSCKIELRIDSPLCAILANFDADTPVVSLTITHVKDENINDLIHLSKLNELLLCDGDELTDNGLLLLTRLASLTKLSLSNCPNISDAGLIELAVMESLEKLTIQDCSDISDKSLTKLNNLLESHDISVYCAKTSEIL